MKASGNGNLSFPGFERQNRDLLAPLQQQEDPLHLPR